MKKLHLLGFVLLASFFTTSSFTMVEERLISNTILIKIFSHTVAEDIEAQNFKSIGTIDTQTGEVVFSVPMQSFEFEKALMQKHFNNNKFLDTKQFPKAKLVGKITNLSAIHFDKDGTYPAQITGELTMKDKTNTIREKGSINVKGKNIFVDSKFSVVLAEYGIAFTSGKPSTNINKSIDINVHAEFKQN
ncbi:YceI family protein [Aquirufa beregesia]